MTVVDRAARTDALDEAVGLMEGAFPGVRFELTEVAPRFEYRERVRGDDELRRVDQRFGGRLRSRASTGRPPFVGVGWATDGELRYRTGGVSADGRGAAYRGPLEDFTTELAHAVLHVVTIDAALLTGRGGHLLGAEVRLPETLLGAPADDRTLALRHALDGAVDRALDSAAAELPLLRQTSLDLVVAAVLALFGLDTPAGTVGTAAPRALRRAVAYLEEHAAEPVTVVDAAAAAGISVRALQGLFRRDLDTTPTGYLHRLRLDAARTALTEGDPGSTSVAEVARRAGFGHAGRFAAEYRERFGESPGVTLRR